MKTIEQAGIKKEVKNWTQKEIWDSMVESDKASKRFAEASRLDEEERKKKIQDDIFLRHCIASADIQQRLRELAKKNGGTLYKKK